MHPRTAQAVVALLALAAAFWAGRLSRGSLQETEPDSTAVIAEWREGRVTVGDLRVWLSTKSPLVRPEYESPQRRVVLRDEVIDLELLAQEARRRRLHVATTTRLKTDELLANTLLAEEVERAGTVDEA